MRCSRRHIAIRLVASVWLVLLSLAAISVAATASGNPTSVTVVADFQSELGCPGDFQPGCAATGLAYDSVDDLWQGSWTIPAGSWTYKAALNGSFTENYGLGAALNGPNIPLNLASAATVKFYYDHKSHWITDNHNSVIVTAPGSFQSELGCPGDWQPDCLRSWLQDPDGDGVYRFETTAIPAGTYDAKATINESFSENYGQGGVPNGANIPFFVPANQALVVFSYDSATHILTITTESAAGPSVTIDQAAGQSDPTAASPINFTAIFSEPVTGFSGADVSLGGTAGATTVLITEIAPNDGSSYNVAVSGMTASGTVSASIPANVATDAAGHGNAASTSVDNTVAFVLDDDPPDTTIDSGPSNPTTSANANFDFSGSDVGTGVAGFECALDGGPFAACASPRNYSGLSLGLHTFQVRAIDAAGNVDPSPASATWAIQATTALLYTGAQIVNVGQTFQPAATLASAATACVPGQPIAFALDSNPFTGELGAYLLGLATTSSSGQAVLGPLSTAGWQEGIYAITATFAGTTNCAGSADEATVTVASPGNAATGGGWYTLSGSGRINFGFTVRKADADCATDCPYKGQLLLVNEGKWRLKGNLTTYARLATGQGAASGTGDLYWWDASLNGGLGDWALAQSNVSFAIAFSDSGKARKASPDTFGIRIVYTPVSPPQPGRLPNSAPQPLKGGDVKAS